MSYWLRSLVCCVALISSNLACAVEPRPIRVGMTPAFLNDQHSILEEWRAYLQRRLNRPVEFVQRDRYRETMDLIQQQKLDFAWVCDYPYVALKNEVRLLVVPINQGKPTYRSYLIVSTKDTRTHSIGDLKGAVFAFADPYSNTGYLTPRFELKRGGNDPEKFFRRTFFTWSHKKAIEAVAAGLAQGAAVDSFVWDSLAKVHPELTSRTRVAHQSEEYGFPPFVAHSSVSDKDFAAMQKVLLDMAGDPDGRALLGKLNLDGFTEGSPQLYKSVTDMMRAFGEY